MAQNPLPKPAGALLILAAKCEAGLTTYAMPLGIILISVEAGNSCRKHVRLVERST